MSLAPKMFHFSNLITPCFGRSVPPIQALHIIQNASRIDMITKLTRHIVYKRERNYLGVSFLFTTLIKLDVEQTD